MSSESFGIQGRVTRSGQPVAGATVAISRGTATYPDIAAITDEQGRYRLSCDGIGEFEILVTTEEVRVSRSVRVESERHAEVNVKISVE